MMVCMVWHGMAWHGRVWYGMVVCMYVCMHVQDVCMYVCVYIIYIYTYIIHTIAIGPHKISMRQHPELQPHL